MYLCSPKIAGTRQDTCLECGEIWLLATTLKNAKILKNRPGNGRFHINVLCFCVGSAFLWGFCFALS
jgi:hypothetical protein